MLWEFPASNITVCTVCPQLEINHISLSQPSSSIRLQPTGEQHSDFEGASIVSGKTSWFASIVQRFGFSSSTMATDSATRGLSGCRVSSVGLACALVLSAMILGAVAADPDPLQDFCVADLSATAILVSGYPCKPRSNVTAADFTFTGFRNASYPTTVSETGATANSASVEQLPGLNTMGVSHARLDFAVGGVVPLHTHPRAAETLFVVKGRIYTGFISDDNVLFASTLEAGDFTVFPRALSHFQLNVGNETAVTFNTLTSQNPGFLFTANQIFAPNISSAVIEKSFGVDSTTIADLRASIPRYWG